MGLANSPVLLLRLAGLCLLCVLLGGGQAQAASSTLNAGFRTLGVWQPEKDIRVDLAIWYPTKRAPSDLRYGPWLFRAARNAKELEGRFPLLLLSHDSPGTRFSHHHSAEKLAKSGFVVAALTHYGDNMNDMSLLFTPEQIPVRLAQIRAALDALLANADLSGFIDARRIGLIGFGAGASAALLLGGATLDAGNWPEYCARAGENDPYCTPLNFERLNAIAATLPGKVALGAKNAQLASSASLASSDPSGREARAAQERQGASGKRTATFAAREARERAAREKQLNESPPAKPSQRDPRIRALAVIAPAYPMFFTAKSLQGLAAPLLFVYAGPESLSALPASRRLHEFLPPLAGKRQLVIEGADLLALMSACPPRLLQDLPELCSSTGAAERERAHEQLDRELGSFFLEQLGALPLEETVAH